MAWARIVPGALICAGILLVFIGLFAPTPASEHARMAIFFLCLTGAFISAFGTFTILIAGRREKWIAWVIGALMAGALLSKALMMWFGFSARFAKG